MQYDNIISRLESDGMLTIYDIETGKVVTQYEGLDIFLAIENAISTIHDVLIGNIYHEELINTFKELKNLQNKK